jgi:phosphohistidine phosphatase
MVWILRHAKALTDPPRGGSDHDRVLAPRGRRDARALGKRLGPKGDRLGLAAGDLPSVVLCSTAARTTETADRALAEMGDGVDVRPMRVLYQADPDDVLEQLRMVEDGVRSVMVVGHNPTAAALAVEMTAPKPASRTVDRDGFPTCGLAVVKLPAARWRDADFGTAEWARLFAPPY